jgi:hypothetical protein
VTFILDRSISTTVGQFRGCVIEDTFDAVLLALAHPAPGCPGPARGGLLRR